MKNKRVALILCVIGGVFGIHKFYENDIFMGIVYLCTVGLGFIGWGGDIIKYITMEEEWYNPQKIREEKIAQRRIKREKINNVRIEAIQKKQEALRNKRCPKCGGENFHAFVTEKEVVPEKRILRHGLNLNPLHPLTHTKTKEKITQKRIVKNVSQFVCDDCGKIFK